MDTRRFLWTAAVLVVVSAADSRADQLCDTAIDDCRAPLLDLITNERVAIDVACWFMEDARYTAALRRKVDEGVPVRVLVDTRANSTYPLNADRLAELRMAGIPMRRRVASGILHWKMMLFEGQNTVQFSAANYTSAFVPNVPYENYVDEAIYFTSETSVVNSFRTKFDDRWVDEVRYADYANVVRPLTRRYDIHVKDPELNFPPHESYRSRAVSLYDAETDAIDVTMYRITDRAHTDAMIRALNRGVPVRLLTEPHQYRDRSRYWHSWNVDRLYAAGAQIRHRAHAGLTHQKSVLLHHQGVTIFGSSNWTSPSSDRQDEHNYFTLKPDFFAWFSAQFERKWLNSTGHLETTPFVPLPPDTPKYAQPADASMVPGDIGHAALECGNLGPCVRLVVCCLCCRAVQLRDRITSPLTKYRQTLRFLAMDDQVTGPLAAGSMREDRVYGGGARIAVVSDDFRFAPEHSPHTTRRGHACTQESR